MRGLCGAPQNAQWSSGLVSAAKKVAMATESLCEAANATVQGAAAGGRMVAAAKAVAHTTAQLLVACKARAQCRRDGACGCDDSFSLTPRPCRCR